MASPVGAPGVDLGLGDDPVDDAEQALGVAPDHARGLALIRLELLVIGQPIGVFAERGSWRKLLISFTD
jgi:hypothetical protein